MLLTERCIISSEQQFSIIMNTQYIVAEKGSALTPTATAIPITTSPTDVLIRLKAIAINPADCKMIDHGHRVTSSGPVVAGLDGAGVVEAVGTGVTRFSVGDEVFAQFPAPEGGSFQDFAVVHESMVAKKPATWSFEDAASLPVCYLTALLSLGIGIKMPIPFIKDGPTFGLKPSSVLVLGGSSAVGASAIQLLRLALPTCLILATSSPTHHGHLVDTLGVDAAFDRSSSSLVSDVRQATPCSRGVDAIIDVVGAGRTQKDIFDAFDSASAKRYAQVWTGDAETEVPDGVESTLFRVRDLPQLSGARDVLWALERLLEEGKYKLPLPVRIVGRGFQGLEKGLELMRHGVSGEKLVVTMD
ncbi:putative alcohol dehydrogenase [Apodospora peruviana]|uniref:Alcohol dehydrogenase n=1 Tax=Apodospora peruviana TaxID=516989 RepID=A0AAE0HSF8_9PEZI|nr:putative alcohol dehydrogenase [Apodospora peruviana]